MNELIVQTACTQVSVDLRNQLLKIVDNLRKVPHYGAIFEKPVDYVGIPLPDYLKLVKRPMDFQMLRHNLVVGEYRYLYEFLHDINLIWANCRAYNQDNPTFAEICNYMEETFLLQLDKLEPRVSPEVFKLIVASNIPKLKPDYRVFSISRLQCLIKELCDLPEPTISECVYWLLAEKNELNLIHGQDVTLRLANCSYDQLERFEKLVLQRKEEYSKRPLEVRAKELELALKKRGSHRGPATTHE